MSKLEQIEQEIAGLNDNEVLKLADWLADFKQALWDRQIENDAKSGKLDALIANARAEIGSAKVRPI